MGFLASAIARKSGSSLELFREIYGQLWSTKSGRNVNLDTAIQVSAVFACLRVIGNGMAQVPLKLMRYDPKTRTRAPAVDHHLYKLFTRRPNPWQTAFEFRQMKSWHLELAGNFYALKVAPAGRLLELLPLNPTRMRTEVGDDLSASYEYTNKKGETRPIPASMIWHVRGPSWEPGVGLFTLQAAREAVGLAMATEESQASLHKHGVRSTGAWSVDGKLDDKQHEQLVKWLQRDHEGAQNAWKPMIMDRAAKWVNTQMSGVEAQHLETRREQIAEVCRFFGVSPIMAGYSDKAPTYGSAESFFLAHVVHCLSPRWAMYEASLDANLLSERELEQGYYFDYVEEGMIRGSVKDTTDAIVKRVNGGIITPNEGRGLLDLNPDSDPASDQLRIPVNTVQDPKKPDDDEPEKVPA